MADGTSDVLTAVARPSAGNASDVRNDGRQDPQGSTAGHETLFVRSPTPMPLSGPPKGSLRERLRRVLGKPPSAIYGNGNGNKSQDDVSISSTASSASIMLRKMSAQLSKRTARLGGLFSGSNSITSQDRQSHIAATRQVSLVVAERSEPVTHSGFAHLRADSLSDLRHLRGQSDASVASSKSSSQRKPLETSSLASANVDDHGGIAFPRLSEEQTSERRPSMHLERPLPSDLRRESKDARWTSRFRRAQPVEPVHLAAGRRSEAVLVDRSPYRGKGILRAAKTAPVICDFKVDFSSEVDLTLVFEENAPESSDADQKETIGSGRLSFNPRVTIHDTYDLGEYDRRGDVATCNRLTPLLAQQIKEELNSYKMDEMEVAEESRIYTQFFS
ncbi:bud neck involved protein [Savitreella phatthalungensis]